MNKKDIIANCKIAFLDQMIYYKLEEAARKVLAIFRRSDTNEAIIHHNNLRRNFSTEFYLLYYVPLLDEMLNQRISFEPRISSYFHFRYRCRE